MNSAKTQRVLWAVGTRQATVLFARRFYFSALGVGAVFLGLMLISRLFGVIPNWFSPASIAAVPVVALAIALAMHRRVSASDAARLVDAKSGTHDLFLASAMAGSADGDYLSIVKAQAEQAGSAISPRKIVPFIWIRKTAEVLALLGLLFVGARLLPQLDPFGRGNARQLLGRQERALNESRKATELRAVALEKKESSASREKADQAIAALEKTFKTAKPAEKETNLARLSENQKELGALWRKASEERAKESLKSDAVNQSFGNIDPKQMDEWKKDLEKGDAGSLKKELSELRKMAERLSGMENSAEKQHLKDALRQRIANLANAAGKELSAQSMSAALSRALEQLDMAQNGELMKKAMDAMKDSLQLSDQELSALSQTMQDLHSLEEALKSAQMAKQLAGKGKLDGEGTEGVSSIEDYEAMYEKLLAKQKGAEDGPGDGEKGPGHGQGGVAQYDESSNTKFKSEESKSALTGGKMLLEWKTNEVSNPGKASDNYKDAIREVKQGVSEAIIQEQVPPGYHDAIKKYFDAIGKTDGGAKVRSPSETEASETGS